MNTRNGRTKFKNFLIILDSGFSSTTVMGNMPGKLHPEKDDVIQWNVQAGNINTNIKVKVDFTVPALTATDFMTRKCHVYDSDKGRCDMIVGKDILIELGLNLKCFERVIEADYVTFKGSTTPMVDFTACIPGRSFDLFDDVRFLK